MNSEESRRQVAALSAAFGPGKFIFAVIRDRQSGKNDVIANPKSPQEFCDLNAYLVRLQIPSEKPHED